MKEFCIGIAALAALIAAPAFAADMALKAPPPPAAPVWSWTGFYIGAQGGGGWGDSSPGYDAYYFCPTGGTCHAPTTVTPPIPLANTSTSGAFGGVTAGYNYQINQAVLGIEGDWSGARIDGSGACDKAFIVASFGGASGNCSTGLRDFGTLTGRFGWAFDRALLYIKGGGAWARYDYTATSVVSGIPGPAAAFSDDRSGYTIGAGIEYAFMPKWSVKLEYQHMSFGSKNITYPFVNVPPFDPGIYNTVANDSERVDIVRAGVNYRFNWAGPAPAPMVTK